MSGDVLERIRKRKLERGDDNRVSGGVVDATEGAFAAEVVNIDDHRPITSTEVIFGDTEFSKTRIRNQLYEYTIYDDGKFGKQARTFRQSAGDMYKMFNKPEVIRKDKDLEYVPWFNSWTLKDPSLGRSADNIKDSRLLVLDIDDGAKIQEVIDDLEGFSFVLYTSKSYRIKAGDRFRVVIFCLYQFRQSEFKMRVEALKARFPYADPASFSMSQGFVTGCHWQNKPYKCERREGELFDLMALPAVSKKNLKKQVTIQTVNGVSKAVPVPLPSKPVSSAGIDMSGSFGDRWFTPSTIFESEMNGSVTGEDVAMNGGIISAVKCLWHDDVSGGGFLRESGTGGVFYKCNNTNCTANKAIFMVDSELAMYEERVEYSVSKMQELYEKIGNSEGLTENQFNVYTAELSKLNSFIGAAKKKIYALQLKLLNNNNKNGEVSNDEEQK